MTATIIDFDSAKAAHIRRETDRDLRFMIGTNPSGSGISQLAQAVLDDDYDALMQIAREIDAGRVAP